MFSTKRVMKYLQVALLGFIALNAAACAMFEGREKPGEYFDDAAITSKVKANIIGDSQLSVFQINVETMQGVVQLSGFVDSAQAESRAVNIAENVEGVKLVKDNLVVRQNQTRRR